MKDYIVNVEVKWGMALEAKSKEEAVAQAKETFKQEFNMELIDDEIVDVEEQ